jgi:transaldolase
MGASFRNTGEIEALAGCDRLTISPDLLKALEDDDGQLARKLTPGVHSEDQRATQNEGAFRWALNEDAMATEKLAEGIRNFAADQVKLEQLLLEGA